MTNAGCWLLALGNDLSYVFCDRWELIMKKYILIFIFGIAGSICRYGIGLAANGAFPWGTLTVNLVGSLLLPFIFVCLAETGVFSKDMITVIGTGFIGAFTTFSAFTLDNIKLFEQGKPETAVLYLLASLAGGLFAAYAGVRLSLVMIRKYLKKADE